MQTKHKKISEKIFDLSIKELNVISSWQHLSTIDISNLRETILSLIRISKNINFNIPHTFSMDICLFFSAQRAIPKKCYIVKEINLGVNFYQIYGRYYIRLGFIDYTKITQFESITINDIINKTIEIYMLYGRQISLY